MDMESLVAVGAEGLLSEPQLRTMADQRGITLHELCDAFAREAAHKFLSGALEWEKADAAMNHLYALAYGSGDFCLPEFAWSVFLAFDEGEYIHTGEDPSSDGEVRTRKLLQPLLPGV